MNKLMIMLTSIITFLFFIAFVFWIGYMADIGDERGGDER